MKKAIIVAIVVFVAGCGEQQSQKDFNIQDLRLGMDKYEVERLCKSPLEFVSTDLNKVIYRTQQRRNLVEQMVSRGPIGTMLVQANGKDTRPYLLVFTNNRLIRISQDMEMIKLQAIQTQENLQFQQIQRDIRKIKRDAEFNQIQRSN